MTSEIEDTLSEYECQPILFVGSGLSQRYFGAPTWNGLLEELAEDCPLIDKPLNYYLEDNTYPEVGSVFAQKYREWAWNLHGEENDIFPTCLYSSEDPEIYMKYRVANHLSEKTPDTMSDVDESWGPELESLQNIQPHAIITTNYDTFLETVFPEYKSVIGEEIYSVDYTSIGEIFKIHGCVTEPSKLVLTEADYNEFQQKKQYLSAKLLTYFAEHPILIAGYSVEDPNIQSILSDIDRLLATKEGDLIPNIYHISWEPGIEDSDTPSRRKIVPIESDRRVRVKSIHSESYEWVYDAFGSGGTISGVKLKLLRKLLANTYDIVTKEAPRKEVHFEHLQQTAEEEELAKLFGVTPLNEESSLPTSDGDFTVSPSGGGFPVESVLTTDPTQDVNERLRLAAKGWQSYNDLISNRQLIYSFYEKRSDLELTNTTSKFLFWSCLSQHFPGTEWLLGYDGNYDQLFDEIIEGFDKASTLFALERVLLVLGNEEKLRRIADDPDIDYWNSNAEEFAEKCSHPVQARVDQYQSSSIKTSRKSISYDQVFAEEVDPDNILDRIIDDLQDDDTNTMRISLRKIELIRLALTQT